MCFQFQHQSSKRLLVGTLYKSGGTHSNRRQPPGPNISLRPSCSESKTNTHLHAATDDGQTQCELNEPDHDYGIP